jgi:sugar/nucleoside kinase (ribokinase family)
MDNKKFDVVVVGELNVDLILNRLEKFPEMGKEIIAKNMTLTLGSSSAIFASNLSSLGARVSFIGKLGYDNFATDVMVRLKNKNVDTTNITKSLKSYTGATIIFNYNEDRAMITYPGAMEEFNIQDITTTSLDPQWDPEEKWDLDLHSLLPYVDVFFPNEVELLNLTKGGTIESSLDLIKSFSKIVVVKNGSKGSVLWDGTKLSYQKAFTNPKIEDCIGAGDSFGAGFIKKYIEKKSLAECLEYASLMGAINTTQAGGTTAFKDIATITHTALTKFNMPI